MGLSVESMLNIKVGPKIVYKVFGTAHEKQVLTEIQIALSNYDNRYICYNFVFARMQPPR